MIEAHPMAKVDSEICVAVDRLARNLESAGARVARESALLPDLAAAHGIYLTVLSTAMSRGRPASPDLPNAHDWMTALDRQLAVRRQWGRLFEAFDVVIAPTFGVTAFTHRTGEMATLTHLIDNEVTPYAAQVAWPGMATLANLPATAVPIGATTAGLPIGAQIIGPYLEDRTTLTFASLIAGL